MLLKMHVGQTKRQIPNKELSVNTKLEQNSYWNPKK